MAENKKKTESLLDKDKLNKERLGRIEEIIRKKEEQKGEIIGKEVVEIGKEEPKEAIGAIMSSKAPISATIQLQQRQKQVEKILESDLEEIYNELSEDKKKEFKIIGEQTAANINLLLDKAKVKIKNIINLIKKWLSLIPGINKYFLEQEAKIKADKIIKMKNNKDEK